MSNVPQAAQPQDDALVAFSGRNFSRFGVLHNIHCAPVDETEEQNYDEVNVIFNRLLGRAVLPEIVLNDLDEPWVLDCGFGKGAWIDTVLAQCDDAYVVGVDIFTGRGNGDDSGDDDDSDTVAFFVKKRWNLNASFRMSRDPELRPESFQLINSRFLTDGINANRWETYVRELKNLLQPGGWLQMVEVHMLFQSDSGRMDRDTSLLHRWWDYYRWALEFMGKNPRIGPQLGNLMRDAGFEQIHASVIRMPIGNWMPGKERLGIEILRLVREMIHSAAIWPFLRVCRPPMTVQQFEALIRGAQQELEQPGLKAYLNVHVAYGRRPEARRR